MRKPPKRLPLMSQKTFGFETASSGPEKPGTATAHFLDDDPVGLCVGPIPLRDYLRGSKLAWVVALKNELATLDYTCLELAYCGYGRRPFHPRTMLGLVIYGVLSRQWTLRELEDLAVRDVGAWWICGGRQPDHSTIGKFVQLHAEVLSKEFFEAVVKWVIARLKLRLGTVSIDGTVIESAASRWNAIRAEAARLAAEQATQSAQAQPNDKELAERAEVAQRVAQVAAERCATREQASKDSTTVQVTPSDLDAVVQPRKDGAMRPGYKAMSLMHESGILLGQHVDPSCETAAVAPLLEQYRDRMGGVPPALLLDAGFHNGPLLGSLAEQGHNVLCPSGQTLKDDDWQKKGPKGRFGKNQFRYDESSDEYRCPANQRLRSYGKGKDAVGRAYQIYRTSACKTCTLRESCTRDQLGRSVKRYPGDEYKEMMMEVLQHPRARACYRQRMRIAEPVHAQYRDRQGLRRFHRRGLINARAEFALHGIAYNLRKVLAKAGLNVVILLVRSQGALNVHIISISLDLSADPRCASWKPRL